MILYFFSSTYSGFPLYIKTDLLIQLWRGIQGQRVFESLACYILLPVLKNLNIYYPHFLQSSLGQTNNLVKIFAGKVRRNIANKLTTSLNMIRW